MEEKAEKNYQVFLNDKNGEVASFSNLSYEQAQSIAQNLVKTYLVKNPQSIVSVVEEG
jgi:hypothetical protein